MDIRPLLQANCDKLLVQYRDNLQAAIELQNTLIEDVLPSVADELELDEGQVEWVKEWLEDTHTIFQLLRRNKYTRSFALEFIRKNIAWRIDCLWPPEPTLRVPRVHCLPSNIRDPLGRPIVVIEVVAYKCSTESTEMYYSLLVRAMEQFRLHLKTLNDMPGSQTPTLQYIILFDVKALSLQTLQTEFVTWILGELIPRFPGMLAAVFMVNSSWVHSGMWNIIKRVLPASAVSRVFFPSQKDLVAYFTPSSLPEDYGGCLPPLNLLEDPLWSSESSDEHSSSHKPDAESHATAEVSSSPHERDIPHISSISPISALNPFFGYPVSVSHGAPSLHHGRRRKRDLFRTLATLFWLRWRRPITTCLWLVALAFAVRIWLRKRLLFSQMGWSLVKTWWNSGFML